MTTAATLEAVAALLDCTPDEAVERLAALVDTDAHKDLPAIRRRPLVWNRKTVPHTTALANARDRTHTHERRAKVWQLRKEHHTLESISNQVGVSIRTVRQDLQWWFDNLVPPDVEQRRAVELDAIDDMTRRVAAAAVTAEGSIDLDAVREWRALRKHYADLAGLTKVPPPVTLVLPSAEQWEDLINAAAGQQPVTTPGSFIDVPSEVVESTLAELVEAVSS